jgi:hypothetical protein
MSLPSSGTPIDWVEEFFGKELDSELIIQASQASANVLGDFAEHYMASAAAAEPTSRYAGHLRPYVPVSQLGEEARHGIQLATPSDLDDMSQVDKAVDALHLHLLYAHSIALPDPFIYLNDYLELRVEPTELLRQRVANYLSSLNYLRPMLQAGTIFMVGMSEASTTISYTERQQHDRKWSITHEAAQQLVDKADFTDLLSPSKALELRSGSSRAVIVEAIRRAIEVLLSCLKISDHYGGKLDLYLPFRYYFTSLRWLMEAADDSEFRSEFGSRLDYLSRGEARELRLLSELLQVTVPDLSLDAKDIIAVRQGEEFEIWRHDLGQALTRVAELREDELLDDGADALRVIRQELVASRVNLERRIESSGFLSSKQEAKKSLVVGSLVALGLAKWFNPVAGLISAAGEVALGLAWERYRSRGRDSDTALLQHYLLFSPMDQAD